MRALAPILALFPVAALAQDAAPDPAREDCAELMYEVLTDLTGLEAYAIVQATPDGWCEATQFHVYVPGPGGLRIAADALRWRSEGLLDYARALVEGGDLPPSPGRLDLEIEGGWTTRPTGDPMIDWLVSAQSVPRRTDGTLSLAATGDDRIELALDLDIPHGNAIRAKAVVEGLDLSSPAAIQTSLGRMALGELSAQITTRDLFETRLLPVLAPPLIGDARDPQAAVRHEVFRARVAIERLPPEIFPDPSRAELYELLTELPNPSGTLSLEVEAREGGGLGLPRLSRFIMTGLPDSPEQLWPALDGVTVAAEWSPLPR